MGRERRKLGALIFACLLTCLNPGSARAEAGFLLIGDSHSVGPMGSKLVRAFGGSENFLRYAISGASALTWLREPVCTSSTCPYTYGYATPRGVESGQVPAGFPGLVSLLRLHGDRKRLIIALGTNDASAGCERPTSPAAMRNVQRLLALIPPGVDCVWIGPPQYRRGPVFKDCGENYNRYVDVLRATVTRSCRFIDSRLIRDPSTGSPIEADAADEVHFTARLGEVWARALAPMLRAR